MPEVSLPTLHLTNSSTRRQHNGTTWAAMAMPRRWERDRVCEAGAPRRADLLAVQATMTGRPGGITVQQYRRECETRFGVLLESRKLAPSQLQGKLAPPDSVVKLVAVADGDTLVCGCAAPDSPRRRHPCHLELLAPFLARAGWEVVLWGRRLAHWCHVPEHDGDTGYDAVVWADCGQEYDPAEFGWPAL